MAERITRELVAKVAKLARLELTEEETDLFCTQLAAILDHVAMLERLDTSGVPPMAQAITLEAPMRDDEVRPGLEPEDAAGPAPQWEPGGFVVPRIIGGDVQ